MLYRRKVNNGDRVTLPFPKASERNDYSRSKEKGKAGQSSGIQNTHFYLMESFEKFFI